MITRGRRYRHAADGPEFSLGHPQCSNGWPEIRHCSSAEAMAAQNELIRTSLPSIGRLWFAANRTSPNCKLVHHFPFVVAEVEEANLNAGILGAMSANASQVLAAQKQQTRGLRHVPSIDELRPRVAVVV